jgi:HDOD domain/Bacterial regulatory proteins, luxR family
MAGLATSSRSTEAQGRRAGRGRVLAAAFDEAERQPALTESRDQALDRVNRGAPPPEVAAAVEADVGLTCAVVQPRASWSAGIGSQASSTGSSDSGGGRWSPSCASYPPTTSSTATAGSLCHPTSSGCMLWRFRGWRTKVAEVSGIGDRAELALASSLHDIGRPVLSRLHPGYAERFDRHIAPPDDRIAEERRELGIDHALVGGVLTRRWGVHARVAEAIERHHTRQAEGMAAVIRLADMVAAHIEESPVSTQDLIEAAETCGLDEDAVRLLLYELPHGKGPGRRATGPCPLSPRELDVLRRLAEGKVYKQIAVELDLSASTRPQPPAQRLQQARRPGQGSGRSHRDRTRLDLAPRPSASISVRSSGGFRRRSIK